MRFWWGDFSFYIVGLVYNYELPGKKLRYFHGKTKSKVNHDLKFREL